MSRVFKDDDDACIIEKKQKRLEEWKMVLFENWKGDEVLRCIYEGGWGRGLMSPFFILSFLFCFSLIMT